MFIHCQHRTCTYGNIHILYLDVYCLADMGTVLKVVTIPRESWHDLEEVVLEEMTVFRVWHENWVLKIHYEADILLILN